jgi:hypothetical protein
MSYPLDVQAEAQAQFGRFQRLVSAAMPSEAPILEKHSKLFIQKFAQKIQSGWVPKKGWATPTSGGPSMTGPAPSSGAKSPRSVRATVLNILTELPDAVLRGSLGIERDRLLAMQQGR